jgi:DNA-binding LytR/AlgR family response regulator
LQSILEKALDEWEQSKQHDFIDHKFFYLSGLGGQREQVSFRNIIYLASESNNCFIFTDTKKYVTKKSLTKILNEDLGDGFLRIHQQYIVNKLHLKIIKPNSVVVKGEIELPIGKSYRKEVNDFLKTS